MTDEHEHETGMLQRVLEGLRKDQRLGGDDQQDEESEEGTS
jgi:hypothetical protein